MSLVVDVESQVTLAAPLRNATIISYWVKSAKCSVQASASSVILNIGNISTDWVVECFVIRTSVFPPRMPRMNNTILTVFKSTLST